MIGFILEGRIYLPSKIPTGASNCNRESIILNLVLSHNVINASTADNNVNVSSLIDIGTNNANLDLRSSHMILQNVAVSDLAIFRPFYKGDIAFLERAGKRTLIGERFTGEIAH